MGGIMITQTLTDARNCEETEGSAIPSEKRPLFHLCPRVGWMNDPNGFSWHGGMYHLFYQYYPYKKVWGPMHWGHAVSRDLLHWEYLPAAIAPDNPLDADGCFSGSAEELPDGRQFLIYTGVMPQGMNYVQTQLLAIEENGEYVKYEGNPVIGQDLLPSGTNGHDFRDPKVWKEPDGTYACVTVDKREDGLGRVLYFTSPDAVHWTFRSILAENPGTLGKMWECPDFFELDGKYVLLVSPMDMRRNETYYNGNGNVCLIGSLDKEKMLFMPESNQPVDCGIDFYATQSILSQDGRRIMIAWMQNWDTVQYFGENIPWAGQMTVPRELHIKNGRLFQTPIRELDSLRRDPVSYEGVLICGEEILKGISGRTIDLLAEIRPAESGSLKSFEIRMAEKGDTCILLTYDAEEQKLRFDRSNSGTTRNVVHERECRLVSHGETLSLRIILDRYSCEVFINGGEQTMSHVFFTDLDYDGISFKARGKALVNITKYDLSF